MDKVKIIVNSVKWQSGGWITGERTKIGIMKIDVYYDSMRSQNDNSPRYIVEINGTKLKKQLNDIQTAKEYGVYWARQWLLNTCKEFLITSKDLSK